MTLEDSEFIKMVTYAANKTYKTKYPMMDKHFDETDVLHIIKAYLVTVDVMYNKERKKKWNYYLALSL